MTIWKFLNDVSSQLANIVRKWPEEGGMLNDI
jgi:hypothetical protein